MNITSLGKKNLRKLTSLSQIASQDGKLFTRIIWRKHNYQVQSIPEVRVVDLWFGTWAEPSPWEQSQVIPLQQHTANLPLEILLFFLLHPNSNITWLMIISISSFETGAVINFHYIPSSLFSVGLDFLQKINIITIIILSAQFSPSASENLCFKLCWKVELTQFKIYDVLNWSKKKCWEKHYLTGI